MRFHRYHFISVCFSILFYLITSYVNSMGSKLGLAYSQIGMINFFGALSYVITSISIGHLGDKFGYKKILIVEFLLYFFFLVVSLNLSGVFSLVVIAVISNLFFGSFYPQIEGLISKSESLANFPHSKTVMRFNLSWSFGNIIGMALGPFMTVKYPQIIFGYGLFLSAAMSIFVWYDYKSFGNYIKLLGCDFKMEKIVKNIKRYRLVYRSTLFFSGLLYTSVLALFPKLISSYGTALSLTGFLIAFANLSVFLTFLFMGKFNFWVGKPKISFYFLLVLPVTSLLMFFKPSPMLFLVISFLSGMCYAIPYTFAIYYGLHSEEDDQGKQGGFHEAVIGLLFGFGPLIGGTFLDYFSGIKGLGIFGLLLTIIVFFIQIRFLIKK
ncbi:MULTISPECIES: MFS transporter [unclassified Thermosipho (in: thermotogales)]|uniref:MFS transporter n=1 Tax=unclassified Thermosipho (in: thermotogales) TaxID=2676525 RepID=UPI000986164F|nr:MULTISPECIES: MFS transporter [unclassified Thermosipho (in: thermotogales)]MBT1248516.1 hypothetical protein [Thermosipho sp. 1244]OOC47394.1 hypothetical protein XO09_02160 [Thermosipho sp. 1223]